MTRHGLNLAPHPKRPPASARIRRGARGSDSDLACPQCHVVYMRRFVLNGVAFHRCRKCGFEIDGEIG
jgi:hypothetical protein